jgi:hypothetical protein
MDAFGKADPSEWRLIPMRHGEMLDEISLVDIPPLMWDAIQKGFFLAIRFWQRVKRYGFPGGNWRSATGAQIRVCETFDELLAKVERIRNGKA